MTTHGPGIRIVDKVADQARPFPPGPFWSARRNRCDLSAREGSHVYGLSKSANRAEAPITGTRVPGRMRAQVTCPVAPRLPKVKAPDPKWDFLSPGESMQLLAAEGDPEKRTLLLFALRTGSRAGEQLALEWGDIDFANKQVVLCRSMALGQVVPTKSGRERRVPLTDELVAALKAHRHLRSKLVF